MKSKILATAAVSAALLTGGAALAATTVLPAYAQSSSAPTTQVQGQTADGQGRLANHPRLRQAVKAGIKTAADTIGIPPKDLVTELRSGKSIADVAREHDVDPQKVIDALVAKADARIDKAVQNGKLTQQRADELKAKVPDRAAKVVNKTRGQHHDATANGDAPGSPTSPTPPSTGSAAAPTTSAPAGPAPSNQLGGDTTTAPSGSLSAG